MRTEELILISNIDHHQMNGTIYRPEKVDKILLIVHGMAEHEKRYSDVAMIFAKHNYLVLTPDLRGHGRSKMDGTMGYFGKSHGYFKMIRDLHQLLQRISETYPVEIVLMGHSMGALFVMEFLRRYPRKVSGVILSGIPSQNPLATPVKTILKFASLAKPKESNLLIAQMMDNMFKFKEPYDWVSASESGRKAYLDDELCGFPFTNAGYKDLFELLSQVYLTKGWRIKNKDLPIFVLSGANDPVSKGTFSGTKFMKSVGYDNVTSLSYENSRHEIYYDLDKASVFKDLDKIAQNLTKV